jgi:four helix bundle protein
MEDFKDLRVWQKAYELTLNVCRKSATFAKEEMYGLTSQLRRATMSIGANIAEGCGRRSDPELRRFLQIACGSANEVECHLLLARDLRFLPLDDGWDGAGNSTHVGISGTAAFAGSSGKKPVARS